MTYIYSTHVSGFKSGYIQVDLYILPKNIKQPLRKKHMKITCVSHVIPMCSHVILMCSHVIHM